MHPLLKRRPRSTPIPVATRRHSRPWLARDDGRSHRGHDVGRNHVSPWLPDSSSGACLALERPRAQRACHHYSLRRTPSRAIGRSYIQAWLSTSAPCRARAGSEARWLASFCSRFTFAGVGFTEQSPGIFLQQQLDLLGHGGAEEAGMPFASGPPARNLLELTRLAAARVMRLAVVRQSMPWAIVCWQLMHRPAAPTPSSAAAGAAGADAAP